MKQPRFPSLATLIAIFAFVTGIASLPQLLAPKETGQPMQQTNAGPFPKGAFEGEVTLVSSAKGSQAFAFELQKVVDASSGDLSFSWKESGCMLYPSNGAQMMSLGPVDFGSRVIPNETKKLGIFSNYSRIPDTVAVGHVYCIVLKSGRLAKLQVLDVTRDNSRGIWDWIATMRFRYFVE